MEGSGSSYRPLSEQQQPEGAHTQPQHPYPQQYGVYQQQPAAYGAYPYQPQPYAGQFGQVYVQPSPYAFAVTRAPARVRLAVSIILFIVLAVMLGAPGWYAANTYSYNNYDYDTSLETVGVWQACADGSCVSVCEGTATADACWKLQAMRGTMIVALILLIVDIALIRSAAKGAEYPPEARRNGAILAFLSFALVVATLGFAGDLLNDVDGFRPYYCFYFNVTSMFLTISSMILALRMRRML